MGTTFGYPPPPPFWGRGTSNMLEFFLQIRQKIISNFCLLGLRKRFFEEAGTKIFLEKITDFFLRNYPPLKVVGNFWRIFSSKMSIFLGYKNREQRNEGTMEWGNSWNDTSSSLFKNLVTSDNYQ